MRVPPRKAALGAVLVALASTPAVGDSAPAIPATIRLDHRGLIEVPGVLRMASGQAWGAANLVVFGPSWGYSAQDYALKNTQRKGKDDDLTVHGDLAVPGASVRVEQTARAVARTDGRAALRVTWTLRSARPGQPLNLQRAYVFFPLAVEDFAGTDLAANDGTSLRLPREFGGEALQLPRTATAATVRSRRATLTLESKDRNLVAVDARGQKADRYELRLEFRDVKAADSATIAFDLVAGMVPFQVHAGTDWVPFPFSRTVVEGSILDFAVLRRDDEAPAGRHGRIVVGKDGHYVFEGDPSRRVRLVGANLCFSANFVEPALADATAQAFRRMGYNAVRFHHTDVLLMKGGWDVWNAIGPPEIDPAQLDKLDYLFAAMKKAGMYVTIDLYAMGSYGRTIAGIDKGVRGEIKSLVPIHEPAFRAWAELAMAWLTHVNPYTGIAWKDDPALVAICPLNEDSIASVWKSAKDLYEAKLAEWKRDKADSGRSDPQLLAQFLTETKVASNREIERFLRANGVKALLSGSNWWDTMAQTFERDTLDVVDNHQYADHPDRHQVPQKYNQKSTLKEGNPTYMVPVMKAPTRIFGKPFVLTEYNFCAPNRHRLEAGAMMGAYASLQDWDALYRFAWAHDAALLREQKPIQGFDIATDPLHQLTERQIVLLFGRGDVAPGRKRYVYGVTMDDATDKGIGDMWATGLFPHPFNALALMSQIGSQVIEGDRRIEGSFDGVVSAADPGETKRAGSPFLPRSGLKGIAGMADVVSDTGELILNNKAGTLRVATPHSCCIVAPAGTKLAAGVLEIANNDTFASVSASSMDGQPVERSRRILLFHLTNIVNTDMLFATDQMTLLHRWGALPYLAQAGAVEVTLRSEQPGLKLHAVASDGTRRGSRAAVYADGAYRFRLALAPGDDPPTMVYELAAP